MNWMTILAVLSVVFLFLLTIAIVIVIVRAWRKREVLSVAELQSRLSGGESEPLLGPPAPSTGTPTPPRPTTFRVGWYLFEAMVVLGSFMTYLKPPIGIAILGLALIYLGTNLHEVRDPNRAFLYRMGKMVGELSAGWYLTIPHFWVIEIISLETFEIDLPRQEMYTKSKRPITLHLRVFYRAVDLSKALFTRKVIHNRVTAVVLSQLKGEVGKQEFPQLLTERGTLEEAITVYVNTEELAPDGYEVTGIEIEDLDENVESRAETIREIGRARGDAARALAEPLRDNYPAAVVSALGSLTEAGERIASMFVGRERQQRQPATPETGAGAGVAEQLTEAARQITRRR